MIFSDLKSSTVPFIYVIWFLYKYKLNTAVIFLQLHTIYCHPLLYSETTVQCFAKIKLKNYSIDDFKLLCSISLKLIYSFSSSYVLSEMRTPNLMQF